MRAVKTTHGLDMASFADSFIVVVFSNSFHQWTPVSSSEALSVGKLLVPLTPNVAAWVAMMGSFQKLGQLMTEFAPPLCTQTQSCETLGIT